jgi:RNA polymerase sigma-70 factor (ECF subfamily)
MNQSEFRALYDSMAPRIRRYLARLVGESEAEDLTQEVFERTQRTTSQHRGEARVSTWLFRIATNAAIDRLRSPGFRRRSAGATAPAGPGDPEEDAGCEPASREAESELVRKEMRHCILELVSRLPESQRAALLLGELRGLKDREVALALGISLESAKIRLHRARRELKRLMEERCDFYRDERNEFACEPKRSSRQ